MKTLLTAFITTAALASPTFADQSLQTGTSAEALLTAATSTDEDQNPVLLASNGALTLSTKEKRITSAEKAFLRIAEESRGS